MKVKTLQPVRHDEEDIEVGTELDLLDHQAEALIRVQAAEASEFHKIPVAQPGAKKVTQPKAAAAPKTAPKTTGNKAAEK
jgi:hypothetical protein